MDPAIEQVLIEADSVGYWLDCLAVEPGFIAMFHPLGRFYSARPERVWHLAGANGTAISKVREATRYFQQHLRITGAAKPFRNFRFGLAGSLNYELGTATVPGFQSGKQPAETTGWIGAFSWSLFVPDDGSRPTLYRHPDCSMETRHWLDRIHTGQETPQRLPGFSLKAPFKTDRSAPDYLASLERILSYISAGDCYQVNFSRRFTGAYQGNPWPAWQQLTQHIPVPYSAYLNTGLSQILSISPEQFLRISAGEVSSKPIKGTRPRGTTADTDSKLRQDLLSHPKDRAENLMIVDLIRNDLSRFCQSGSVKVPEMFTVESYSNVHQLVSRVTGRLVAGTDPLSALLSAFPGGSITGAPKRRAMEIIDELEPHTRDAYCGTVFFLDQDSNLDSNIAIRTLETHPDGRIHCWGGGGIVADSVPEEELRETEFKVRRLMDILEGM